MKLRIAFDLDETLGVPLVDGVSITGFRVREGGLDLLQQLKLEHCLILWSVADRPYVNRALSFGLAEYFTEIYSWDEIATRWKDIRRIRADYLIDDSPHHRESARAWHGGRLHRRSSLRKPRGPSRPAFMGGADQGRAIALLARLRWQQRRSAFCKPFV